MGRGRQGTGVEPLKGSIRVRFTWMGVREAVTLDLKPTPPNIRATEKLMQRARMAIENGTFRHEDYFPQLAAPAPPKAIHTFADYADLWLKGLTIEHKTRQTYTSSVTFWKRHIGEDPVDTIKHSRLRTLIAEAAEVLSPASVNAYLLVARGVFGLMVKDEVIIKDPTEGLVNHTIKKKQPDPLTKEERDAILAHMADRYDAQVANYFELSFLTGMRPEEVIALTWGKIDWMGKRLLVDVARVNGRDKGTKTGPERYVDLTDRAMAVLIRQKPATFLKGLDAHVFENPATARPWASSDYQRRDYWDPTLKALGIRKRVAYQTRHTYATLALMDNVNVVYLAAQLGHASPMTTLRFYARWIEGADHGAERAKMASAHGQFRGQFEAPDSIPQENL